MANTEDSVQIRCISNQAGVFASEQSVNYYMPMPPMSTEYSNFTNRIAPAKENKHEGYFLEDYCQTSDLPTNFKKVSSQSTNVASSSLMTKMPASIQGAVGLFSQKGASYSRAFNGAFDRNGINLRTKGDGTMAVGTFKKNSGRLNDQKASWDTAVGVNFTWNTGNWEVKSGGDYKIDSAHLCYMTPGSSETFIARLWSGGNFANTTADSAGGGIPAGADIKKRVNKDNIASGWNQKPYVSGNIYAYISDDDIAVVTKGNYVCTGMIFKFVGSASSEISIYDFRFLFDGIQTGELASTRSLRVLEPPQLITEKYDRTKYLLAQAP